MVERKTVINSEEQNKPVINQQNIKFIFKIYDKKTKKELKPEFGGDILVGEYFTLLRHYKPINNGGYSFYRDELLNNENLIIKLDGI